MGLTAEESNNSFSDDNESKKPNDKNNVNKNDKNIKEINIGSFLFSFLSSPFNYISAIYAAI